MPEKIEKPQWIVTKQIAVSADTPEEAAYASTKGKTMALSVNPRPQVQATTQQGPAQGGQPAQGQATTQSSSPTPAEKVAAKSRNAK